MLWNYHKVMKKSLSPRRELLGLNKLEQVSWLVLRRSPLNKQAYTRGDDEENHLFHADCERLLPFAMLALCFLTSVRCSSLALLGIWIACLAVRHYILAGQQSPHWQLLHICRSSLKRENVLTIAFSLISLFFCTSVAF